MSPIQQRARLTAWLTDAGDAGLDIDELNRLTGWPSSITERVLDALNIVPPPGLRLHKISADHGDRYVLRADPELLRRAPAEEIADEPAPPPPYPRLPLEAFVALHAACSGENPTCGDTELLERGFLDPTTRHPTTDVQFSLQWYR